MRRLSRAYDLNDSPLHKLTARSKFLDDFLLYQLSIASGACDRLLTKMLETELDLSLGEWRVILMVGEVAGLSTDALAARTTMDKARVSRAITRLVALGYLKREIQNEDRRLISLFFTDKGRSVFKKSLEIGKQAEKQFLDPLSKFELAQLFSHLAKLAKANAVLPLVPKT